MRHLKRADPQPCIQARVSLSFTCLRLKTNICSVTVVSLQAFVVRQLSSTSLVLRSGFAHALQQSLRFFLVTCSSDSHCCFLMRTLTTVFQTHSLLREHTLGWMDGWTDGHPVPSVTGWLIFAKKIK